MKMTYLEAATAYFALAQIAPKEWPQRTHKRIAENMKEFFPIAQSYIQDRDAYLQNNPEHSIAQAEQAVSKDWLEAGLEKEFTVHKISLGDTPIPGILFQRLSPVLEDEISQQ